MYSSQTTVASNWSKDERSQKDTFNWAMEMMSHGQYLPLKSQASLNLEDLQYSTKITGDSQQVTEKVVKCWRSEKDRRKIPKQKPNNTTNESEGAPDNVIPTDEAECQTAVTGDNRKEILREEVRAAWVACCTDAVAMGNSVHERWTSHRLSTINQQETEDYDNYNNRSTPQATSDYQHQEDKKLYKTENKGKVSELNFKVLGDCNC
ncbi:Hypothetical predicted protein [Mytilus galloprovincialis]|uniref:Uncharacterized protein n=1 Tax=Mytilus galloprovincialis TaxID=29158 RepID=A0A8B6H3K9_MYTGA|nr:Hypothetical predicted protein [Mytilus galloprovincialis]